RWLGRRCTVTQSHGGLPLERTTFFQWKRPLSTRRSTGWNDAGSLPHPGECPKTTAAPSTTNSRRQAGMHYALNLKRGGCMRVQSRVYWTLPDAEDTDA